MKTIVALKRDGAREHFRLIEVDREEDDRAMIMILASYETFSKRLYDQKLFSVHQLCDV